MNARLRRHLLHHLLKASGVVAEDQRVDGFRPFALGQRPAGFHIAKMRREQQFALRIVEPQRLLRAWRKDQIAMEFHFAAPAGHFIQHGMTEAQEVGKTVKPREGRHLPLCHHRFNPRQPLLRRLTRSAGGQPVDGGNRPQQGGKRLSPQQLPDAQHQAHAP